MASSESASSPQRHAEISAAVHELPEASIESGRTLLWLWVLVAVIDRSQTPSSALETWEHENALGEETPWRISACQLFAHVHHRAHGQWHR